MDQTLINNGGKIPWQVRLRHTLEVGVSRHASVIDQNIDPPSAAHGFFDQVMTGLFAGDVRRYALDSRSEAAQLLRHLFEFVGTARSENKRQLASLLLGHLGDQFQTDPFGGARYNDYAHPAFLPRRFSHMPKSIAVTYIETE